MKKDITEVFKKREVKQPTKSNMKELTELEKMIVAGGSSGGSGGHGGGHGGGTKTCE